MAADYVDKLFVNEERESGTLLEMDVRTEAALRRVAERKGERPAVTFLPEPEPRPRKHFIVSVDDHLVEPPNLFEGRLASKYKDMEPRVVEFEDGVQLWEMEGRLYPNTGNNAVVGRPQEEYSVEPSRFDEMRRGTWDVDYRVKDMDIDGVWASLCFPSTLSGFAGWRFARLKDQDFALAVMRAWNDWHLEAWAGAYPERLIPQQIPWLNDVEIAAEEIRRNAERGFRAVSFPDVPDRALGLPSLHTDYWDPFVRACEETETVICLHVGSGSGGVGFTLSPQAPVEAASLLFPISAYSAGADWLFSTLPARFPNLKIALSEGGVGWVPFLLDRLEHDKSRRAWSKTWAGIDLTPAEVFRRNFWFCGLDEVTGFALRDAIGVDHIMVESDYPHQDTTWPDSQAAVAKAMEGIPAEEADMMTHLNAAKLFRFPLPDKQEIAKWMSGHSPASQ